MAVELNIEGMDQFKRKIEQPSNPKKVKQIARKASRQAMNIARDAARNAAKAIDDPETAEKIYKEIVVHGGKSRNSNEVKFRVGVRGGARIPYTGNGYHRCQYMELASHTKWKERFSTGVLSSLAQVGCKQLHLCVRLYLKTLIKPQLSLFKYSMLKSRKH